MVELLLWSCKDRNVWRSKLVAIHVIYRVAAETWQTLQDLHSSPLSNGWRSAWRALAFEILTKGRNIFGWWGWRSNAHPFFSISGFIWFKLAGWFCFRLVGSFELLPDAHVKWNLSYHRSPWRMLHTFRGSLKPKWSPVMSGFLDYIFFYIFLVSKTLRSTEIVQECLEA